MASSFKVIPLKGPIPSGSVVGIMLASGFDSANNLPIAKSLVTYNPTSMATGEISTPSATNNGHSLLTGVVTYTPGSLQFVTNETYYLSGNPGIALTKAKKSLTFQCMHNLPTNMLFAGTMYTLYDGALALGSPTLQFVFVPLDGSLYNLLKKGTVSTLSGQLSESDYRLMWSSDNMVDVSSVCYKGGWIADTDTGCMFTSKDMANQKYMPIYCAKDKVCSGTSDCYGECSGGGTGTGSGSGSCAFDYNPKYQGKSNPYNCAVKYALPLTFTQKYMTYIIIAAVVGAILVIGLIVLVILIMKRRR